MSKHKYRPLESVRIGIEEGALPTYLSNNAKLALDEMLASHMDVKPFRNHWGKKSARAYARYKRARLMGRTEEMVTELLRIGLNRDAVYGIIALVEG